jgi:hypothetical protein
MPPTSEILKEGWIRNGTKLAELHFEKEDGFSFPRRFLGRGKRCRELCRAAREEDLDAYWNEVLKLLLEPVPTLRRKRSKSAESQLEYKAREDFRHALLRHDWGQLNQALDAAHLPWAAWLSTNYTGFSDRALALYERESSRTPSNSQPRHWSIVSTSHDAVHLTRRLLHGEPPGGRTLFKLHGHIEHLLTMAIAGEDKEIYSTLSLPVDSLHEVYSVAELYLNRHLNQLDAPTLGTSTPIFWHVVGHRMKDALLKDLVLRVCEGTSGLEHYFLFVRPDVTNKDHEDFSGGHVVRLRLYADEYLARLRRFGMSVERKDDLRSWVELMDREPECGPEGGERGVTEP